MMAQWRDVRMISVQFELCSQHSHANDSRSPVPETGRCSRRISRTEARRGLERLVGVHRRGRSLPGERRIGRFQGGTAGGRGRSLPEKRIRRLQGRTAGGHDVGVEQGNGDRTCLKEPMTGLLCGAVTLVLLGLSRSTCDREEGIGT